MTEYKGFSYEKLKPDTWKLVFPSKFKTQINAESEEDVLKKIDHLVATAGN